MKRHPHWILWKFWAPILSRVLQFKDWRQIVITKECIAILETDKTTSILHSVKISSKYCQSIIQILLKSSLFKDISQKFYYRKFLFSPFFPKSFFDYFLNFPSHIFYFFEQKFCSLQYTVRFPKHFARDRPTAPPPRIFGVNSFR